MSEQPEQLRGLGDAVKAATNALRVPCGQAIRVIATAMGMSGDCGDRQAALNKRFPFPVSKPQRFEYKGASGRLSNRPRTPVKENQ